MRNSKESSKLNFQFFFSQIELVRNIKKAKKSKVDLVFYNQIDNVCILKQYYKKDLSGIYKQLQEIKHKNLPKIYQVLFYNGDTYLLEENIAGSTLREVLDNKEIEQKWFSEKEIISIIGQVCDALSILHNQNPPIIHRDIKPENIMMRPDGTIKLIDFDIARVYQEEKDKDTQLLGTEEYASPEHFGYGQTNEKSDIYSIGVVMNELLTGRLLKQHQVTYEGALREIIERCVEIDPRKRYDSVLELKENLESYKEELYGKKRKKKKSKKHSKKTQKREIIKIGILLICILTLGIFYYQMISSRVLKESGNVQEKQEKIPDVWLSYKNQESPSRILKNEVIQKKLEDLLGAKYTAFMNGMEELGEPSYNTKNDFYYLKGTQTKLYSILNSMLIIHADGEIECGLLQNEVYYYYAEKEERYDNPSLELVEWLVENSEYQIVFKGKSEQEQVDLTGSYVGEKGHFLFEESENNTYSVKGMSYDPISEIGRDTVGTLREIDQYNWKYIEEWGGVDLEIKQFYNFIYVTTVSDAVEQSENLSFDGLYKKTE